jgi:methionyl aminopeptidase
MLRLVHTALDSGIRESICGNTTGHISYAIQKVIENNRYSTPLELGGHGIGTKPHQPPFIPNYGVKGSGVDIINGMCLAIEPIMIDGSNQVVLGADNWTVSSKEGYISVHEEDTLVVNGSIPIVLTRTTLEGNSI